MLLNVRPCPEWLYLTFGSILAGIVVVGKSFTNKDGGDLVDIVNKLRTCSLLVLDPGVDGQNWENVSKVLEITEDGGAVSQRMSYLRYVIGHRFDKGVSGVKHLKQVQELIESGYDSKVVLPEIKESDVMALFQTTGSTGVPKLVAHTHDSVMIVRRFGDNEYFNGRYRLFNSRPFNWIGGFPFNVLYGQTRVTVSEFGHPADDPVSRETDVIKEENCNLIVALAPRIATLVQKRVCHLFLLNRTPPHTYLYNTFTTILAGR